VIIAILFWELKNKNEILIMNGLQIVLIKKNYMRKDYIKIKTFHYPKRDKGQKLIVKNDLEYQFAKLNFNENVKIIRKY
jgi:hypothetical protein